ncbi:hypothetical protein GN244_ATG08217 [Phytophthora infestans]|uniref:Uncharacterized protein n=1 Tax=Phytophthora infestans TaxID=4787 RepID=A0A833WKK7_PHYIN|nr:hypothetical protein GN244_ATG08217 [Phytophthora infestans]
MSITTTSDDDKQDDAGCGRLGRAKAVSERLAAVSVQSTDEESYGLERSPTMRSGTDFARQTIVVEDEDDGDADGAQALTLESAAKWKDYERCGGRRGGTDECQKTNERQTKDERITRNEGSDGRVIVLAVTGRTRRRRVKAHGGASTNNATTGHLWVLE